MSIQTDCSIDQQYQQPDVKLITIAISFTLSHVIEPIETNLSKQMLMFHTKISQQYLTSFLRRISAYANCSPDCYILAIIYIDRLLIYNPEFQLNWNNIHQIIITAILISTKIQDDRHHNNNYYATLGNIPLIELNQAERTFLELIKYDLHISLVDFNQFHNILIQIIQEQTPIEI